MEPSEAAKLHQRSHHDRQALLRGPAAENLNEQEHHCLVQRVEGRGKQHAELHHRGVHEWELEGVQEETQACFDEGIEEVVEADFEGAGLLAHP